MDVYDAIRTRRAIRDFAPEPIPEEVLLKILNAGRLAGSSKNSQPWHFIVIRERARLRALSACGQWAGHLAGAAVGVALVTGDWRERWPVAFDLGRAAQNMMLTAHGMGIGSVIANIYDMDRAHDLLHLPEDKMCYAAISFGYQADPEARQRPPRRGRKRALAEVVHWEKW
jgi:nitroreductase